MWQIKKKKSNVIGTGTIYIIYEYYGFIPFRKKLQKKILGQSLLTELPQNPSQLTANCEVPAFFFTYKLKKWRMTVPQLKKQTLFLTAPG